ncbi:MAG: HDIG domain-containing metalloprotein [Bacteroidota bacterium]
MGIQDRLGLGPKPGRRPRRSSSLKIEKRKPDDGRVRLTRQALLVRAGLLLALTVLALLAFPRTSAVDGIARVGEPWNDDDVVAPFNFAVRLPEEVVQAKRDSVARAEPPIFVERPEALDQTLGRLDSLDARFDSTFAAYNRFREARALGSDSLALRDSLVFEQRREALGLGLTNRQIGWLVASAFERGSGASSDPSLDDRLLAEAARISREVLERGLLDVRIDSVVASEIVVRNLDPTVRSEINVSRGEVLGRDQERRFARRTLGAAFPGKPDTVDIALELYRRSIVPNYLYQQDATQRRLEERLRLVEQTRDQVRENTTIIRDGDVVTQDQFDKLRSLQIAQRERTGDRSFVLTVIGRALLVLAALSVFFLYLYLLRQTVFDDARQLVLITLLLGSVLVGFWIAGATGLAAAPFAVPVALVSILLAIVFDSRVASFATMTLALLAGLIFGSDFLLGFATLFAGLLGVFSVRDVKNRSQLLISGGLVLAAYALVLFAFALLRATPFDDRLVYELIAAAINAVLLLLAWPLLAAIERGFGVTTDITLLELSDTNRPVLKELSMRAPGTFNHSLQVANLAEAAAAAVGANALRTRVGAIYHDIGKMLKPEYFIENQQAGENPHDKLKPSMSALVIAAHVKDGLDLGRQNKLPKVVLDFIATHHGTGLMEFFYRRAQENAGEDADQVKEADFRYPGPRPQTDEQAIVMLADSVEAASRSLDKPNPRRLQSLIESIFEARVADGQLDESDLTFADLAKIRETFQTLLAGIYHFRVKYPDQAPETDDEPTEGAPQKEGLDVPVPEGTPVAPERSGEREEKPTG